MPRTPRPSRFAEPVLIDNTEALTALCERLAQADFVTADTEFMRERTYWPELCVVQLASDDEVAVVDAQAPGLDLAPLWHLLTESDVPKVFHAARQDVEIVVLATGRAPRPIHDTQIMAMVAGFGDQAGYDSLVGALTGASVDKHLRFSDWSVRPLSAAQVAYAAADVTHLRRVYRKLKERLDAEGRMAWVAEETASLGDPASYRVDPDSVWVRLRSRSSNRRYLGALRAAAAWREREAQRVNVPRQRVLKDEALLELAGTSPEDAAALGRTRGMGKAMAEGKAGAALLAALKEAAELPEGALPESARDDRPKAPPAVLELLKVLLKAKCDEHRVAQKLVASTEDLERVALGEHDGVAALSGWRREVFGEDALALVEGRVGLAAAGRRIRLVAVTA